jgi:glycosyltransferase involved in cell wall biosynthesis
MSKYLENQLAIVIPFFKIYYLEKLLLSLVAQTDKRFNLYIVDDASPHAVEDLIKNFNNILQITYKRFDENLGSSSLVKHWHRSISLTQGEKWIWLIGDDDFIDDSCVRDFYSNVNDIHHVYRFSTQCINSDGRNIKKTQFVKSHQFRSDYLRDRLLEKHRVSLSECIFSRASFDSVEGFMEMPLAYASDVVAWYMFSGENGIRGINTSKVYLRTSEYNISARRDNLNKKRFAMDIIFYKWVQIQEPLVYKETIFERDFINEVRTLINNNTGLFKSLIFIFNSNKKVLFFTRIRATKLFLYYYIF